MENVSKAQVTIEPVTVARVRHLLALAQGDDRQGVGLDEILRGCWFFELRGLQDAQLAYALKPAGSELWIQAAGGRAKADLTVLGLAAIERQAVGFKSVGFQTRRRGLVEKAKRAGYEIDGYIMRKVLSV